MNTANKFSKSATYYHDAVQHLAGGVSSNFRLGMKPFPLFFDHASGSHLVDVDGNDYIDYALGMGPVILGHAHPAVNEAVARELHRGQLFAGQNTLELDLAREICALVPCAELVRFSLSGSEAVQAALRVARAVTGRTRIVKFEGQYHGWFDNIYVSVHPAPSPDGQYKSPTAVPASEGQDPQAYASDVILSWNDTDALRRTLKDNGDIAAVIMEPIMCNTAVIPPQPGYLHEVRQLCREHGVLLIFDEVITGFRVGLHGAQGYLDVTPDVAVFAKAMANGYPISCVAGRRGVLQLFGTSTVVHGGTFNGNTVSCAAALATLRYLKANADEIYGGIAEIGGKLIEGLRRLGRELHVPLVVQGFPAAFHTTFGDIEEIRDYRGHRQCRLDLQSRFVDELMLRGVRITGRGTWFLSAAHTAADVETTLRSARTALMNLDMEACAART
jgi:glutamate-1-semialdehyde 2,1-aminomutase